MGEYWEDLDEMEDQALLVTGGPFEGRICLNDDDDYFPMKDFTKSEVKSYQKCGVQWRRLRYAEFEGGPKRLTRERLTPCEFVTFGHYLGSFEVVRIPRQVLRPATAGDLVARYGAISERVSQLALNPSAEIDQDELVSILTEKSFIMDQIWTRERLAMSKGIEPKKIFLCHSSADKGVVRQVHLDLVNAGHSAWIDEFEIRVGDSIVEKISSATAVADAIVIFLSVNSIDAPWVRREWQSTLMRMLSGKPIRILPVLLDNTKLPEILADLRYADFRESYSDGLRNLFNGLS